MGDSHMALQARLMSQAMRHNEDINVLGMKLGGSEWRITMYQICKSFYFEAAHSLPQMPQWEPPYSG